VCRVGSNLKQTLGGRNTGSVPGGTLGVGVEYFMAESEDQQNEHG